MASSKKTVASQSSAAASTPNRTKRAQTSSTPTRASQSQTSSLSNRTSAAVKKAASSVGKKFSGLGAKLKLINNKKNPNSTIKFEDGSETIEEDVEEQQQDGDNLVIETAGAQTPTAPTSLTSIEDQDQDIQEVTTQPVESDDDEFDDDKTYTPPDPSPKITSTKRKAEAVEEDEEDVHTKTIAAPRKRSKKGKGNLGAAGEDNTSSKGSSASKGNKKRKARDEEEDGSFNRNGPGNKRKSTRLSKKRAAEGDDDSDFDFESLRTTNKEPTLKYGEKDANLEAVVKDTRKGRGALTFADVNSTFVETDRHQPIKGEAYLVEDSDDEDVDYDAPIMKCGTGEKKWAVFKPSIFPRKSDGAKNYGVYVVKWNAGGEKSAMNGWWAGAPSFVTRPATAFAMELAERKQKSEAQDAVVDLTGDGEEVAAVTKKIMLKIKVPTRKPVEENAIIKMVPSNILAKIMDNLGPGTQRILGQVCQATRAVYKEHFDDLEGLHVSFSQDHFLDNPAATEAYVEHIMGWVLPHNLRWSANKFTIDGYHPGNYFTIEMNKLNARIQKKVEASKAADYNEQLQKAEDAKQAMIQQKAFEKRVLAGIRKKELEHAKVVKKKAEARAASKMKARKAAEALKQFETVGSPEAGNTASGVVAQEEVGADPKSRQSSKVRGTSTSSKRKRNEEYESVKPRKMAKTKLSIVQNAYSAQKDIVQSKSEQAAVEHHQDGLGSQEENTVQPFVESPAAHNSQKRKRDDEDEAPEPRKMAKKGENVVDDAGVQETRDSDNMEPAAATKLNSEVEPIIEEESNLYKDNMDHCMSVRVKNYMYRHLQKKKKEIYAPIKRDGFEDTLHIKSFRGYLKL